MTASQAHALEAAAQRIAAAMRRDYSAVRMLDHYFGQVRKPDPKIVAIVKAADEIVRPLLDSIQLGEDDKTLLQHRIRTCQAECVELADYVRALPGRLPEHIDGSVGGVPFRNWLEHEIAAAPVPHYARPGQEPTA
ncbi:hypothetical protein DZ956_022200 [Pseudomonas aeruginosa]|uniref:hypothetical protein n=1 Tax=Pseudomonas aeruginosa TaxID=287 RepID=UPI000E322566|nr:hypothetical protein [Pseudomonas aeruginosa]NPZ19490.1 hypothetical protein [Pseudomonas aeruginosa]